MAETETPPRWRRRKAARPGEIIAAALDVFAERGFAAARLEDVAARAGVSKAALYLYFPTKADLFRAVAEQAAAPVLEALRASPVGQAGDFEDGVEALLNFAAALGEVSRLPAVAKMVIGESRNFPDLARVWHDKVAGAALALLTRRIEAAQARGEVRPGDPRLHALSLAAPIMMALLWREVFVPIGAEPFDLQALARQHARTALEGLKAEATA